MAKKELSPEQMAAFEAKRTLTDAKILDLANSTRVMDSRYVVDKDEDGKLLRPRLEVDHDIIIPTEVTEDEPLYLIQKEFDEKGGAKKVLELLASNYDNEEVNSLIQEIKKIGAELVVGDREAFLWKPDEPGAKTGRGIKVGEAAWHPYHDGPIMSAVDKLFEENKKRNWFVEYSEWKKVDHTRWAKRS